VMQHPLDVQRVDLSSFGHKRASLGVFNLIAPIGPFC
jgi:hypothetical protein